MTQSINKKILDDNMIVKLDMKKSYEIELKIHRTSHGKF